MATRSAQPPPDYSPYDVVPLKTVLAGEESYVDTVFGPMRCLTTGAADAGPTVGTVFMHGVHDDMDSWAPLAQAAANTGSDLGRALFVDLPGFGRSANHRARLEPSAVGDAVLLAARHLLGEGPTRLVGHSMGSLVAADLAVRRPDQVASLHLVAGPFYSIVDAMNGRLTGDRSVAVAGAIFASQYVLALTGPVGVGGLRPLERVGALRPLLAPFLAHPGAIRPSVIKHVLDSMRPGAFRAAASSGFRYRRGMSWAAITCPVHAIFGREDRLVPPRDGARLASDVPTAMITLVEDAGHLIHIERPAAALTELALG